METAMTASSTTPTMSHRRCHCIDQGCPQPCRWWRRTRRRVPCPTRGPSLSLRSLPPPLPTLYLLLLWLLLASTMMEMVGAWRQWDYRTNSTAFWKDMWGGARGPGGRKGHSLVLDGTRVILFGGRDDETRREHTPRTFDMQEVNGVRSFTTYEDHPMYSCSLNGSQVTNSTYYGHCDNNVEVGLYYNDVWAYELNCTRYYDKPCEDRGWEILHPGAFNAECRIVMGGREICRIPSERYYHSAVMFDDRTMIIYGGFSQRCEDYCDDMWSFDLRDNTWLEIYEVGHFRRGESPGKRWRFSMLGTGSSFIMFGGHRLWHGYAAENSWKNRWESELTYPKGGYMDDLWIYDKKLLAFDELVPLYTIGYGTWRQIKPQSQCFPQPGETWADRFEEGCETVWPIARAGHAAVLDKTRNGMWMHGGYTTYFPYRSTASVGAGSGTKTAIADGIPNYVPYPTYPFYLDDLWFFNISSGLWHQVYSKSSLNPGPRAEHTLVLVHDILILMGGFNDNVLYDDTWYFNLTTFRWLQKKTFVHPLYPVSCNDDLQYIRDNNCTELNWTKPLDRYQYSPHDIKPYGEQSYYYPDSDHYPYWGILDKGTGKPPAGFPNPLKSTMQWGTPIFPYAATGPRQYARPFVYHYNGSHNATLLEYCTSVKGNPTRGRLLDGQAGRANGEIFIPQPRRQAPGWDGCRDRYDNRTDLPNGLVWAHPTGRSQHMVVYSPDYEFIILYGGQGYVRDEQASKAITHETHALSDMWQYNINNCPNNCSNHGSCHFGFCTCDKGYYGVDCSNSSCPGDFCYYDDITHEQVCIHCCSAGYKHTDNDTYVDDAQKLLCSLEEPGESNGVCDGFGTCQCAPPFLGDDCSIKDCKHNCSFNGYCSVEYPVSRCMCLPTYFGEYCQYKECLNNCTYPNGVCNYTTGLCTCRMTYVPFNNTRPYYPFGGEDCSFIVAFAGAGTLWHWRIILLNVLVVGAMVALFVQGLRERR